MREDPFTSSFYIILLYIGLVVFAFPILYMTVALGFAFTQSFESRYISFAYGLVLITFSVLIGGIIALLISRQWLSKTIKRRCLSKHKSFLAINHVVTRDGWKTVFLLRLTPFPYSVVSYLLGFTALKLKEFIVGSMVVSLHIALWLYIGMSLDHFKAIKSKIMRTPNNSADYQATPTSAPTSDS